MKKARIPNADTRLVSSCNHAVMLTGWWLSLTLLTSSATRGLLSSSHPDSMVSNAIKIGERFAGKHSVARMSTRIQIRERMDRYKFDSGDEGRIGALA